MTLPLAMSWPDFTFWGWVWFLVGAGFTGAGLLEPVATLAGRILLQIAKLKKEDRRKAEEWKNERDCIASAIVKAKYVAKLDQMRASVLEEGARKRNEFEDLVRQNREDAKSQYFSKLGLYCGLLSFFRSIEEDVSDDYYCLKILGVPVVTIRSEELLGGESAQINESMYLDHSFLAQYVMPLRGNTQRLTSERST